MQNTNAQNGLTPLRIKFSKTGDLKFISHLDMMRTLRRAIARADIPLAYSQGFNPHPKLTLLLPLSLGTESICEYTDIVICKSDCDKEDIKNRLSCAMPSGIDVLSVKTPVSEPQKIAYASYIIKAKAKNGADTGDYEEYLSNPIFVDKKCKSGIKSIDISSRIAEKKITKEGENLIFDVMLAADNENYLNPDLLITGINKEEKTALDGDISILRYEILLKDKTVFE
ncbi:MAG: DUF2344 domain-containing protein [Clostridia bacterium]|nr:DUF2344 domain-containing protein [Clostridia bacterium]